MARILVVDDNDDIRRMLRQLLQRAGYEVADTASADEALQSFREKPADLLIVDLLMPEKQGMTSISEFLREFPNMKIIAISGAGREFLAVAKKLGALRAYSKPLELNELLQGVKELLE
jgi:two-component system response regulator (stage 0 sporulation protein F)